MENKFLFIPGTYKISRIVPTYHLIFMTVSTWIFPLPHVSIKVPLPTCIFTILPNFSKTLNHPCRSVMSSDAPESISQILSLTIRVVEVLPSRPTLRRS